MTAPGRVPAVAISAAGTVGAYGCGLDDLRRRLAEGTPAATEIEPCVKQRGTRARTALMAREIDLSRWLPPLKARRMSMPSRFAVTAMRIALEDAGIDAPEENDPSWGVVLSTTFGPSSHTERMLQQMANEGPDSVSPALFTECVANAAAAQVSLHGHTTGINQTVAEREAGPLIAVTKAAAAIRAGHARRAWAGVAEEVTPLLQGVLDRFGALAHDDAEIDEAARPFDRRRNGFTLAEGSTLLLLEDEDDLRARGAAALGRIAGWIHAFDPSSTRTNWGHDAAGLSGALTRGLARNGFSPQDFGLIVSGASGAVDGDRLEAAVLRQTWGDLPLPPIVTPKRIVGEYGGGFLAASLLALNGAEIAVDDFQPDRDLGISPHPGPIGKVDRVLLTTLASNGAASWLILERPWTT